MRRLNLAVQISWQAQHCVNLDVQISWQAQHLLSLEHLGSCIVTDALVVAQCKALLQGLNSNTKGLREACKTADITRKRNGRLLNQEELRELFKTKLLNLLPPVKFQATTFKPYYSSIFGTTLVALSSLQTHAWSLWSFICFRICCSHLCTVTFVLLYVSSHICALICVLLLSFHVMPCSICSSLHYLGSLAGVIICELPFNLPVCFY